MGRPADAIRRKDRTDEALATFGLDLTADLIGGAACFKAADRHAIESALGQLHLRLTRVIFVQKIPAF